MFGFINDMQAACSAFWEEVSPSYAVRKYEKVFQDFPADSFIFRRACLKLMRAYHRAGKTSNALTMYQRIMRKSDFFSAAEPKGIEGALLYELAYFQSLVLHEPVLAKVTAERAAEIATTHNARAVLELLKLDFPECLPAA